jgi:hypothetical protein
LGFSGNNRRIDISYSIDDVKAIRVELKDGLSPRRTIYLCVKGQREIPLTRVGQPMTLEEIETQAAELAQFYKRFIIKLKLCIKTHQVLQQIKIK